MRRIRASVFVLSLALAPVTAACGSDSSTSIAPATSTTARSTDPFAAPSVAGTFALADGRNLHLRCWGEGSPTVVLEPGDQDAGVARFQYSEIARRLAASNEVCAYDRAGLGESDGPPAHARTPDDLANDADELLAAAKVAPPYVYVGSSFGGGIAMAFAALHPQETAGVVLLDSPTDNLPNGKQLCCLPVAWNAPENIEHLDHTKPDNRRPIDAPLVVVTASSGQSSAKDQSFWLHFSPHSTAVTLTGGHVIYNDNPQGIVKSMNALLGRSESDSGGERGSS